MPTKDLETISADEFRAIPDGTYYINSRGSRKPNVVGTNIRVTRAGRMTIEEWVALARQAVLEEKKDDLLNEIKDHCTKHCAWLHSEAEIEEYSLRCLISGAYKHWNDFSILATQSN